jgi:hypothetical protein
MTTFIEFLEELDQNHQTVVLPAEQVEQLVRRFGPAVRAMGFWNKSGDGSVQIPMSNIIEAVRALDNNKIAEAVSQLKSPGQFAGVLDHGSASRLIEALSSLYLRQFQDRVERFQNASDPAETERLRGEIANELFGT